MNQPISVIIAGSTNRTVVCAQALIADTRFKVTHILTPSSRPIGRKQLITPNALDLWAKSQDIPTTYINTRINEEIKVKLLRLEKPDVLLVVDFGYIVPAWMLNFPKFAPVNIHPSDLPKYRGSSPGQFCIAFGETNSCITVIRMDEKLDHGPIIEKVPFVINEGWTSVEYYQEAFRLLSLQLPQILISFIENKSSLRAQSDISPTPIARQLRREDGYVPFEILTSSNFSNENFIQPIPFLQEFSLPLSSRQLYNLYRAFNPWPGLWTLIHKDGKEVRLKVLAIDLIDGTIHIRQVQLEGKKPQSFESLKI